MRYVVTGATGFVGGALAAQLRGAGHELVALVRDRERAKALTDQGVDLVVGDLADTSVLSAALAGVDGLFHVAGWYKVGVRDTAEARTVNVEGTRSVLTAARQAGTPKIVYTSTLAVNSDTHGTILDEGYRFNGQHLSAYDETKAEAHRIARAFADDGLPVVTVMPGLVYGPADTSQTGQLLRSTILGRRVVVPVGARLCWAHVDDVARGHVLAMERGIAGESYMLAGPPYSLAEALRMAASIAGTKPPRTIPTAAVRALADAAGIIERVVPVPPLYASEALRSGVATYLGSPGKAGRELGWSARPLEQGLRETVQFERARANLPG